MMVAEYRRADGHIYRNIAGEHLLIALRRTNVEPFYAMTSSAAAIWERLEGWVTAPEVADAVVERYEVARDEAAADVAAFLEQLMSTGAIQRRERLP